MWRLAPLLFALAGLGLLIGWTLPRTGGELVFPLDDAYIHLAVARTLAESGTWGVNPGEFASASSSPLWTALLACLGSSPLAALLANVVATGLLLDAARRWLDDEGKRSTGPLLAMIVVMPLPFLAGLGMEHVLHAALAVALVRAVERSSPAVPLLAVLAVLTRYETLLLCVAMGGVLRSRSSAVALVSAAAAVVAFGAWSAWQGGSWLPNGITKKANAGAWAGVVAAAREDPWVLLLGVACLLPGTPRGRVVALTVAMQAVFGRFGWFWRYEGWLLAMGALVLGAWVRPARAWVLVLLMPLSVRSYRAVVAYPVGARYCALADVALGRWLATTWPGVPVAVHDLGASAYYGRSPVIDLAGLGTEAIAARHRAGTLDAATMGQLLEERGVVLAVAGRAWLDDARPPGLAPVASLFVEYPQEPGEFETVIWAVRDVERVRASAAGPWPQGVRARLAGGPEVDLGSATLEGAAVRHEEGGVTFYTNGSATMRAPASGTLALVWHGTEAEGRGPRFTVEVDGVAHGADEEVHVELGASIVIRYADDLVDAEGHDRNLYLRRVHVRAPLSPSG